MRLALYQPDIAQNVGSAIRLAACFGVPLDIIEPCGFPFDMRRIQRVAMDYADMADIHRHASWQAFLDFRADRWPDARMVLATTKAAVAHHAFAFHAEDIVLTGRESGGVPDAVADSCDARIRIPMQAAARSLNVAQAAAVILGEALRQTQLYPAGDV